MSRQENSPLWFSVVGENLVLVAHTRANPSDEEWARLVDELRTTLRQRGDLRTLVFTDGGAPSSGQRSALADLSKDRAFRIGVVSDAAIVRFVASSIALFNRSIKTFSPANWRAALTHLSLSPSEITMTETALRDLVAKPGGTRFATVAAAIAAG